MDFTKKLENILKQNKEFCDKDGELLKQKVKSLALSFDEDLIELLLSDKSIKEHFFKQVNEVTIFDYRKFIDFIDDKNFLLDSYTKFSNKVGLTISNKHIKQIDDVVLTFPFKDCILEGGQTKEDEKKKEIFFNEILAKDEINRLLDKKVITNATKYYYEDGKVKETKDFKFTRDKEINKKRGLSEDTITDNLIIKGNNLLVLHSLKSNFAGKVKLIYIDPPYNTGNDSFGYNDNFNHSTWLTFMKNRLEVARELLSDDGVIFVQSDNNEQAYLKVLMDEIFYEDNFIETLCIVNNPRGRDYGGIANMHEYIHIYSKNITSYKMYKIIDTEKNFPYIDDISSYEIRELRNRNTAFNNSNRPNLCYPFYVNPNNEIDNGFLELSLVKKDGFIEVYPAKSQGIQTVWRWGKPKAKENLNIHIVGKAMKENGRYMIVEKYRKSDRLARSVWWDKDVNSEKGTLHLRELFNKKVFSFPKPETLISRIIEIATIKNDIVLDFHLGSGTTCAVAHKMQRQYIGIEQMHYIEDISVKRLEKVIEAEQGGISKTVNWQGGGEFIYFELDKYNQKFIDDLSVATEKNILDIYKEITKKGFLNYDVELKKIKEHFEEFKAFSLEDKKEFLVSILNKNMLYKNLSEIEDEDLEITDKVKDINKDFYNIKDFRC